MKQNTHFFTINGVLGAKREIGGSHARVSI